MKTKHISDDLKQRFEQAILAKVAERAVLKENIIPPSYGESDGLSIADVKQLKNCTDVMPDFLCTKLGLPNGSTFHQGICEHALLQGKTSAKMIAMILKAEGKTRAEIRKYLMKTFGLDKPKAKAMAAGARGKKAA